MNISVKSKEKLKLKRIEKEELKFNKKNMKE